MTSETIVSYLEDQKLCINKEILVTWTRVGTCYKGTGRIVELGPREATVELLHAVGRNAEYEAGDRIKIPRYEYRRQGVSSYSVQKLPEQPFVHKDFL